MADVHTSEVSDSISPALETRLIRGIQDWLAIEPAWKDLERRTPSRDLTSEFDWAYAGYRHNPRIRPNDLLCITVWSGSDLVAAWPFFLRRVLGCRVAKRLGCGSDEDYGPPLLDGRFEAKSLCQKLVSALASVTDVAVIPALKDDHPSYDTVKSYPWKAYLAWESDAIIVDPPSAGGWTAFEENLSSKLRTALRYEKSRISKAFGSVETREPQSPAELERALDFFIEHKRKFLNRIGAGHWFTHGSSVAFLGDVLASSNENRARLLVTWAGEFPIAAAVCFVDQSQVVYFATTYDTEYSKYSPGRLVLEGCIKLALETGRTFDFGLVIHSYKERWGGHSIRCESVTVASTSRGRLFAPGRRVLGMMKGKVRSAVTKALLLVRRRPNASN